jgi:TM2 domain-containing membrane protein YozV
MADEKFCPTCGASLHPLAEICPKCGVRQPFIGGPGGAPSSRPDEGKRIAAGICALLVGSLGIHKFILGLNTAGLIMLLVSILTCGIGAIPMHIIGLIEGIIYLSKSDEDFYQTYIVGKKEWF